MQDRYRAFASTWLLATFAGIGFVLTKELGVPFDRSLLVAALALAGATGIALLWNLDLMVYHRLLEGVFKAGVDLENAHPELPSMRNQMLKCVPQGGSVLPRVVFFYLGAVAILVALADVAFTVWAVGALSVVAWIPLISVSVCAEAALLMTLYRITSEGGQDKDRNPRP